MITIKDLDNQGCDVCYQSAYSDKKRLKYISHSNDRNTYLYRCQKCRSYWEFSTTSTYTIDKTKAKELYSIKSKFNKYFKLLFVLIYIVIFYYAWAKSEIIGGIITVAMLIYGSLYKD